MFQFHVSTTAPLGPGASISEPVAFISPATSRGGVSLAGLHRNAESQSMFATGAYEQHMPTEKSIASVNPDVNSLRVTYAESAAPFVHTLSNTDAEDNYSPRDWFDDNNNRDFYDLIQKAPQLHDNTKMNSKTIDPPTQIPGARFDMANEANSYRPLDIPACGSYSSTSCGLTTATLNHTSPTKHNAGPSSGTLAANAGSATNGCTVVLSKEVNALVNSPFLAHNVATCSRYVPSIVVDSCGLSAVASVPSDAPVQFGKPVKITGQLQNERFESFSTYNSVRTSGAATSIGNYSKEDIVASKQCRICSSIIDVGTYNGTKRVCRSCRQFFNRHTLEHVQTFYLCYSCCEIKYVEGKRIKCIYCRFMKCLNSGMKRVNRC